MQRKENSRPTKADRVKAAAAARNAIRHEVKSKVAKATRSGSRRPPSSPEETMAMATRLADAARSRIETYISERLGNGPHLATVKCLDGSLDYLSQSIMSNHALMLLAGEELAKAIGRRVAGESGVEIGVVTVTSRELDTSLESATLEVGVLRKQLISVLNTMSDHYIGSAGCFASTKFAAAGGGHLARPYGKGVVWGTDIRNRADAAANKLEYRFSPGQGAERGINIQWLDSDVDRKLLHAILKSFRVVQAWPSPDGVAIVNEVTSETHMALVPIRCLEAMAGMRLERVLCARGQGKSIRAEVLELTRSWLLRGKAERRPPLHPDEVLHRCYDLWKALNVGFRPVLIKY